VSERTETKPIEPELVETSGGSCHTRYCPGVL